MKKNYEDPFFEIAKFSFEEILSDDVDSSLPTIPVEGSDFDF